MPISVEKIKRENQTRVRKMKQRQKEMNFRFDEREDRNKGDMTVKRDKNLLNRIYELFMNSVCDPSIDVGLTSRELNPGIILLLSPCLFFDPTGPLGESFVLS